MTQIKKCFKLDNSKLGSTQQWMTLTCCQDHILTENTWFVWSETSYSGDERRCYRCGTNDKRTNSEDRATQPMKAGGWVSQFKNVPNSNITEIQKWSKFKNVPNLKMSQIKILPKFKNDPNSKMTQIKNDPNLKITEIQKWSKLKNVPYRCFQLCSRLYCTTWREISQMSPIYC